MMLGISARPVVFASNVQPMPYVVVPPGGSYVMTLRGSDTETVEQPRHRIVGLQTAAAKHSP